MHQAYEGDGQAVSSLSIVDFGLKQVYLEPTGLPDTIRGLSMSEFYEIKAKDVAVDEIYSTSSDFISMIDTAYRKGNRRECEKIISDFYALFDAAEVI